jgi:hypothetical protein
MSYSFEKVGVLLPAPADMPTPGPYYISIVDLKRIEGNTYDYALYFSTDHNNGEGGIWLYLCKGDPSEPSNWLSVNEAMPGEENPIYHDSVQGNGHTETPYANIINNQVYLSYHKNGIPPSQATLLALSDDGVNFKRVNGNKDSVILQYNTTIDPGDGHTGYFRWGTNPFEKISQSYIGYSLHGGTDDYYSALWGSDDGQSWTRLEILIPIEGQALDHPDRMIIWHELDPNSIRPLGNGEYSAICAVGNRASGGSERIVELYEITLAGDGCTLTRPAKKILGVEEGFDSEELSSPILLGDYLFYIGASQKSKLNTIMLAKKVKADTIQKRPLSLEEGCSHIWKG